MLELSKAATFFACLFALYWGTLSAFFVWGPHWQDRFFLLLAKLALAAAVCLFSAVVFRLPVSSNPDANQPITSTLPMKLFFWAAPILLILFVVSWYLTCGAPALTSHPPACS